jgi:ABC-2 type transport system ATP-binding protein
MEFAVEIRDLTKTYKTGFLKQTEVTALDSLNLTVQKGQIFGFLGGNGAGKTTTIKVLMGLLFATRGSAKILGRDIADMSSHGHIGYCPENPYFYDYLSPIELMDYFGRLFGLSRTDRNARAIDLLNAVGLSEADWKKQLRKFSKGMLQRVGLAQSLINDPEVIFLDEPMSGLDPIGRREIRELIAGLRAQGKTVFMSTHILSDIEALCDEVAILRNGRLAASGNLQDLLASENGQQGFEVILTNIPVSKLRAAVRDEIDVSEQPSGLIVRCGDETEVERMISATRSHGGKLVAVQQVKQSLEDLFSRDHA